MVNSSCAFDIISDDYDDDNDVEMQPNVYVLILFVFKKVYLTVTFKNCIEKLFN